MSRNVQWEMFGMEDLPLMTGLVQVAPLGGAREQLLETLMNIEVAKQWFADEHQLELPWGGTDGRK